jgi:nucleoside-diphosphate-sugar epimerase
MRVNNPRIALIGGSGFVGTALSKQLVNDNSIFSNFDIKQSPDFPKFTSIVDVRDLKELNKKINNIDVIINLAAEHKDNVTPVILYDQVNVDGAVNVCKIARTKKIHKIIFTSSVAVYGFAEPGTNELGIIKPFNDYGRTKYEAELVYKSWQAEDPENRTLVILRPTVIFGEGNRGNFYNLIKQIYLKKFLMVGQGENKKSIAYVENVAAFITYSLGLKTGLHTFNYTDKPDLSMNQLIKYVNKIFKRPEKIYFRIPLFLGFFIGRLFDIFTLITKKKLPISYIRIRKFCSESTYTSLTKNQDFTPPFKLMEGIHRTITHEFFKK